jgi:hypothetical protein
MRRRRIRFRAATALALLATATAAGAVGLPIGVPLPGKPGGLELLVAGVVVVGLIAWRRLSAGDFADD